MKIYLKIILSSLSALLVIGCGDDLPTQYEERYIIEAFVIGGEPIEDIRIVRTFPINQPYDYADALVRDATVTITDENDNIFPLTIAPEGEEGWFYQDTNYLVTPNTKYFLTVQFADGGIATGSAFVPDTFSWTKKIPDFVPYPTDEEIGDTEVKFSWTAKPGAYLLRSWAMDTLDYGSYLQEAQDIENKRIPSDFRNERSYDNVTTWGFIPSNDAAVIWGAFRWYGQHEISIYNSDFNMLRWFLQARGSQQYNDLLNTIEGDAIGCFGGATVIRDTSMLLFPGSTIP